MIEIKSDPFYSRRHKGTVIVAGAAPCVYEEIEIVRNALGPTSIIAVNGMVKVLPCLFGVGSHYDLFLFRDSRARNENLHWYPSEQAKAPQRMEGIDHIWRGPMLANGTSSLPAAIIAKKVGFNEIILCGVPLQPTGYIENYPTTNGIMSEFDGSKKRTGMLQTRRDVWRNHKKAGHLEGVFSMSGATREILGAPSWLQ